MVLVDRVAAQYAMQYLAVTQFLYPFMQRYHLAVGGENTGDMYKIVFGDLGVPEGFLETGELFFMPA